MSRIHVIIDPSEREAFRAAAQRAGVTLSEWLREAGRRRLREASERTLRSVDDLEQFFEELDLARADETPEDDWIDVKARIAASRVGRYDAT